VKKAIAKAEKEAIETLKAQGMKTHVNIKHYCKGSKDSLIFDSLSFGERRDIDEGQICNISNQRAMTNIDFETIKIPFMYRHNNSFKEVISVFHEHRMSQQSQGLSIVLNKSNESDINNTGLRINIYG